MTAMVNLYQSQSDFKSLIVFEILIHSTEIAELLDTKISI